VTQQRTILAVAVFLGLIALGGVAGLVFLIDRGTDPEALAPVSTIAAGAAGALGAMLVSTRSAEGQATVDKANRPPLTFPPVPVGSPTPAAEEPEPESDPSPLAGAELP
jgi:hypothetical protein